MAGSIETIYAKSGYMTPERAAEIDSSQDRVKEWQRQEHVKKLCQESGIWPRYREARLDDVQYAQTMLSEDQFSRYMAVVEELKSIFHKPGILILCGDNGPGKTHLASALVAGFCIAGRSARFTTANDFFLALKSTFGERGSTQEDVIKRFRKYELLALDEIEVRSDSAWENQQLRDLINARYSCVLSTLIITNKTSAEINGANGTPYFGNAIRDRIRQDGAMLHCDWPSLRAAR